MNFLVKEELHMRKLLFVLLFAVALTLTGCPALSIPFGAIDGIMKINYYISQKNHE